MVAFLLISFGLTWGTMFVVGFVLGESLVNPLVQLPLAFSPAIAALVVRRWVTGEGFGDARLRLRFGQAKRYYLMAWIGPVLVLVASVGIAAALGLLRLDPAAVPELVFGADVPVWSVLLMGLAAPIIAMPIFWGEEFGWRGYLQQRTGRGPVVAALITGIVWAVWHFPLVFTDYTGDVDHALTLVTWTPLLMAQAIILAWLLLRSGSIWVPCLAHAGNNMIIGTFSYPLLVQQSGIDRWAVNLLEAAPMIAICVWLLLTGRLAKSSTIDTEFGRSRAA